jgi:excisionase family DNA binding protein
VEFGSLKKSVVSIASPEPRLLTIKQAAVYLGTTEWFIRSTGVWDRKIPHVRLGKRILFDRCDLDRFVDDQKKAAA